jgi:hypothetical protein
MKRRSIICNEADYLQAHLTGIVHGPGQGNPIIRDLKEWVNSIMKIGLYGRSDSRRNEGWLNSKGGWT